MSVDEHTLFKCGHFWTRFHVLLAAKLLRRQTRRLNRDRRLYYFQALTGGGRRSNCPEMGAKNSRCVAKKLRHELSPFWVFRSTRTNAATADRLAPLGCAMGKGRKERSIPLWSGTASQLRQWLREQPHISTSPLFPSRLGSKLSRTNVTERLQLAVSATAATHPALTRRKVTPHIFRHSLAMHLLQAGVDVSVIALWLGHESPTTTHIYVEADLEMKEKTLKSLRPPSLKAVRFRPSDQLMQFLTAL